MKLNRRRQNVFSRGIKNRESNKLFKETRTQFLSSKLRVYYTMTLSYKANNLTLLEVNIFLLTLGELKHLKVYLRK